MGATQPGSPRDTGEEEESRGLGPVVTPEKAEEDEEEWFPVKGSPGIEVNRKGQFRTNLPVVP